MSHDGTITHLIGKLKQGDRDAAQGMWQAYFHRLVSLARAADGGSVGLADGEDVALSAFDSFFRGVERGRFPDLEDRDDLWQLLFVMTVRKAINLVKHEGRARAAAAGWSRSATWKRSCSMGCPATSRARSWPRR